MRRRWQRRDVVITENPRENPVKNGGKIAKKLRPVRRALIKINGRIFRTICQVNTSLSAIFRTVLSREPFVHLYSAPWKVAKKKPNTSIISIFIPERKKNNRFPIRTFVVVDLSFVVRKYCRYYLCVRKSFTMDG